MMSLSEAERIVRFTLPYWATVAVMTNDDAPLPDLEGREVWKFDVGWAESDIGAAAAGACVERMKAQDCDYLVIPSPVFAWLGAHPDFRRFMDSDFRRIAPDQDACLIYSLSVEEPVPIEAADGLPVPPPEMVALVAGQMSPDNFLRAGRLSVTWISEMLARNDAKPAELKSILDFGCGCGRVIRHWPQRTGAHLHGSDYNPLLIDWCRKNLPIATFAVNALAPPLEFEDDSFDLVYSLSIFTHLDEPLQVPWMQELMRVLRPGGLMLLTFHGKRQLDALADASVRATFEAGELAVLHPALSGGSGCSVWHPESYIRDVLAKDLEIVDFARGAALDMEEQDAVLFRKPERR
jgi:SAM-dependent methyltransferase